MKPRPHELLLATLVLALAWFAAAGGEEVRASLADRPAAGAAGAAVSIGSGPDASR